MTEPDRGTRRDRGAVLPLIAIALPVLVVMTSFAVDLGRQRAMRRDLQANADVIALDLVRIIDDAATPPSSAVTLTALKSSLARNDLDTVSTVDGSEGALVEWGNWTDTPAGTPCPQPIVTAPPTCFTAGLIPINAVRVTFDDELDYFFQPGTGSATRSAVATMGPRTGLTVGSVAAGLQLTLPAGGAAATATVEALNARLAASFGASIPSPGTVGLSAVSYQGLAATDVEIWRIAQAGGFASPNELLQEELTVGEFLSYTASALDQQAAEGDPNAAASAVAVRELGSEIQNSVGLESAGTIRMGKTIEFAQGGDDAAAAGSINVVDLLSGGAEVINGKHFLSYSFNPGLPGVARATVQQYVVSPAKTKYGPVGTQATNKQMGFQITLDVAPLLGMIRPVTVPIVVEAATATGTVDAIRCDTAPKQVDVDVDTSVLSARVGTAQNFAAGNFSTQAGVVAKAGDLTLTAVLQLGLSLILGADLKAEGSATLLGANDQMLTFEPEVPPNDFQRAQGGIGATNMGAQLSSTLKAKYGSGSSLLNTNLAGQLGYVFSNLDQQIVGPLLTATGVSIGGADVKAHNLECGSPMLVG